VEYQPVEYFVPQDFGSLNSWLNWMAFLQRMQGMKWWDCFGQTRIVDHTKEVKSQKNEVI